MPNRILRQGILDSEPVNSLTWQGEIFYRRVMSIADDFGRFDARLKMIRSQCFPLKLDHISEVDIEKWIQETVEAGLVNLYEVDNKKYGEILNFNQTVRVKKSKFPPDPKTRVADDTHLRLETNRNETNQKTKPNSGIVGDVQTFFKQLENSSYLETIAMNNSLTKDYVIGLIKEFRKKAELEYPDFNRFLSHFKNFVQAHERKKPEEKTSTSVVFGKKKSQ